MEQQPQTDMDPKPNTVKTTQIHNAIKSTSERVIIKYIKVTQLF